MCLAQGPQRSDAGEAQTRYPSVSSQALYHWATVLPTAYLQINLSQRIHAVWSEPLLVAWILYEC